MPRFDLEQLRVDGKRLAQFVIVDTDDDDEFAVIETAECRVIGLDADHTAPRGMIERNSTDGSHRDHDTSPGAVDESDHIISRSVTDDTRAHDDHRAEVGKSRRESQELIASLKDERLDPFGNLVCKIDGKLDLSRPMNPTQGPTGDRGWEILNGDGEGGSRLSRL